MTRPAYAGIGSRKTPAEIRELMGRAARALAQQGWVLRTGLAPGADQAFYLGARELGPVELYLPWPGFEHPARDADRELNTVVLDRATPPAREMARAHHPAWDKLREGARRLHARNCHQILGPDLASAARMVVCWTPDGSLDGRGGRVGGTGQALRLAHHHGIPVLNLARAEDRQRVTARLAAIANGSRSVGVPG